MVFSDYVRAKLKDGGDLPRTPPLRIGAEFTYDFQDINANLDVIRYQEQDKVSDFESTTDGYTMVNATVSYQLPITSQDIVVYVQGTNLTDTEARVHSSFLKDIAPRPGRSFAIGLRGNF
jgi:iron complex outermembrane receptor protein